MKPTEIRQADEMTPENRLIAINRERECYLTDESNVYFLPQGWAEFFSDGPTLGGLKNVNDDGELSPEIYCYAPTHTTRDSEVETMFVPVSHLASLREVSEEEARIIHPRLFAHLQQIDNGECG